MEATASSYRLTGPHGPDAGRWLAPGRSPLSAQAKMLYRLLSQSGSTTIGSLTARMPASATHLPAAIEELIGLGLVHHVDGVLAAFPYDEVIDRLLAEQARIFADALDDVFERQRRLTVLLQDRWALAGDSSLDLRSTAFGDGCAGSDRSIPLRARNRLATLHPGSRFSQELLDSSLLRARGDLERGIQLRAIHQTSVLGHPPSVEYLSRMEGLGGQIRLRAHLPFRLLLIDHAAAVCAVRGQDGAVETFMLRGERLVEMLGQVFESTWVDSMPLTTAIDRPHSPQTTVATPSVALTDLQRTIVRCLAEGATDQAIARSLGITKRTVSRRLGEIYEVLGVQSRFQAGAAARRLGLI